MKDNFRVIAAGFFGAGFPVVNFFLVNMEPLLRHLLLISQIGVAAATFGYILAKWRKLRKK